MNSFHLLHLLFFLFLFTQFLVVAHGCYENERMALLEFKSLLQDPSNLLSSWQEGHIHQNCCNWHGVQCSSYSFHVISIDLRDQYRANFFNNPDYTSHLPNALLTGKLSPFLFNLAYLEYLDLSFNDFQGSPIPHQFNNLKNLTHLDISHTWLSGSITTQFNNLSSSLRYLDVSIYGTEASSLNWVRGLHNLEVLKLGGVDLSEASSSQKNFAEPLSYLSNLRVLDLSHCDINGSVFPELRNHSRLSTLNLKGNRGLQSTIPLQLANLTSLSILGLFACNLQGSVPYLPQLKELDVSGNVDLHPDLTKMFERPWPKLQRLDISSTKVRAAIPSSISNAPLLVHLDASFCSVQGSLPSSICNLSSLRYLDLNYNNLTGTIPRCITKLRNLEHFDITKNSIGGDVSLFSLINELNLTVLELSPPNKPTIVIDEGQQQHLSNFNLEKLILPSLNMTGFIPTYICNLTRLETLDLSHNNLSGSIPSCLFKMNNLISLDLSGNSLSGSIPSCLYKMNSLISLDLSGNKLSGAVPSCLFEFKTLSFLDLSRNNLHGTVPRILHLNFSSSHPTRFGLNLSYNNFHGPLPLPPIVIDLFDVSHNKFSGEISEETGVRLSSATSIFLSDNELSGSIPSSLFSVNLSTRYSHLSGSSQGPNDFTFVDLSNNKLTGIIPASIGNFSNLYSLNLGANNLTGNIPDELAQADDLAILQLNDNKLNGAPLISICNLLKLGVLNLANNNFEGSIPTGCGILTGVALMPNHWTSSFPNSGLTVLSLKSNKFNGSIPEEIIHLENLRILDLSRNYLTGQIPRKLGNFTMLRSRPDYDSSLGSVFGGVDFKLQMVIKGIDTQLQKVYSYSSGIDLSSNLLEGSIPEDIGRLKGLSMLNLSHNDISGVIPGSVGSMNGLESLDLSFNKLRGHIPKSLASMDSLGYLSLTHNNLSGRIPRGPHFDTLGRDGSAYVNNSLLCGLPTVNICEGDQITNTTGARSPNEIEEDDQDDAKEKLLVYAIVAMGFAVGFWGLFFVLLLKKQKWWFPYWRFMDVIAERVVCCLLKN